MAAILYSGDTCHAKGDPSKIGIVDRTHPDIETHRRDLPRAYPGGIRRHHSVSRDAYNTLLSTFVPPRGTVVLIWCALPWHVNPEAVLIAETALVLVDREVLVGDIVKKSADDPVSGIVSGLHITANLIPSRPWPAIGAPATSIVSEPENAIGWYNIDPAAQLRRIPTDELEWAMSIELGDSPFVVYKDWFGRVAETYEEATVRLSNGSVVTVDSSAELESTGVLHNERVELGDIVKTKKGNLRRGVWHYGAYDANIEPIGIVVAMKLESAEVHWLGQRYGDDSSPTPPDLLEAEEFDNGNARMYDRYRVPVLRASDSNGENFASLSVAAGDKVRFRDIARAAVKYGGTNNPEHGQFKRIPRTQSSGYEANHFIVSSTEATVEVRWQDMSVSSHRATELVPSMDIHEETEMWPGEMIVTRKTKVQTADYVEPEAIGIVQSVQAKDRWAKVKWFRQASVTLGLDEGLTSGTFFPGSFLGPLDENEELCSLYDIWTISQLPRRIGDIVTLVPFHGTDAQKDQVRNLGCYDEVENALKDNPNNFNWIGEIVALGLNGLLTVRLGASTNSLRDIQVPWECTAIAWASDAFDEHDSDFDDDSDMDSDSSDGHMMYTSESEGVWEDELGRPIDQDGVTDEEWVDEDEDEDAMDIDGKPNVPRQPQPTEPDSNLLPPPPSSTVPAASESIPVTNGNRIKALDTPHLKTPSRHTNFSYDTMFSAPTNTIPAPESFAILDGSAPSTHHYSRFASMTPSANVQRLRRIQKEYQILASSLPPGVYVRTWESTLHLLRILILGPLDTPYEYAPFVVDMYLHPSFPSEAPQAFFHSWDAGTGPINPNLYVDGKICLSLLGTWPGDSAADTWSRDSTLLQLIVSLLGLVLVKQPFYNEAGYEVRSGTAESRVPAEVYAERTYFNSRLFLLHALQHPPEGIESLVRTLYVDIDTAAPRLLLRALWTGIETFHRSRRTDDDAAQRIDPPARISPGAAIPLARHIRLLLDGMKQLGHADLAQTLELWLDDESLRPAAEKGSVLGELAAESSDA